MQSSSLVAVAVAVHMTDLERMNLVVAVVAPQVKTVLIQVQQ